MFKRMEIAEQVYKGVTTSKKYISPDTNRDIRVRKWKGLEAASPTNPDKVRYGKREKNMQAIRAMGRTVQKRNACCMAWENP